MNTKMYYLKDVISPLISDSHSVLQLKYKMFLSWSTYLSVSDCSGLCRVFSLLRIVLNFIPVYKD